MVSNRIPYHFLLFSPRFITCSLITTTVSFGVPCVPLICLNRVVSNRLNQFSTFSPGLNNKAALRSQPGFSNYINLGSYLAGLWEGDGHISISKPDAKYKNLSLSITFHLKDLPLAERLKDVTGFG